MENTPGLFIPKSIRFDRGGTHDHHNSEHFWSLVACFHISAQPCQAAPAVNTMLQSKVSCPRMGQIMDEHRTSLILYVNVCVLWKDSTSIFVSLLCLRTTSPSHCMLQHDGQGVKGSVWAESTCGPTYTKPLLHSSLTLVRVHVQKQAN